MTDYEAGYLQALRDMQVTVCGMVNEREDPQGKLDLLEVLSFLGGVIGTMAKRHGDHGTAGASNENASERDD